MDRLVQLGRGEVAEHSQRDSIPFHGRAGTAGGFGGATCRAASDNPQKLRHSCAIGECPKCPEARQSVRHDIPYRRSLRRRVLR